MTGAVNTGGRGEAIVLFLAVSFLSACVDGVSRLCLRPGRIMSNKGVCD
jgi:hypothetical protein